jgi:hypothetical protein
MSTVSKSAFWERRWEELRAVMRLVFGSRNAIKHPPPASDQARAIAAASPVIWIPRPPCEVERVG